MVDRLKNRLCEVWENDNQRPALVIVHFCGPDELEQASGYALNAMSWKVEVSGCPNCDPRKETGVKIPIFFWLAGFISYLFRDLESLHML